MDTETVISLTSDIVSSHTANNSVSLSALPDLIRSVYDALSNLGKAPEPIEEKREPAVSIRASVKPDAITCLECGKKLKMLKRHLGTDHGFTPAEYKARWGLGTDYPLVAPDYAAKRAELAVKIGLGTKGGRRKAVLADSAPITKAPTKRLAKAAVEKATVGDALSAPAAKEPKRRASKVSVEQIGS